MSDFLDGQADGLALMVWLLAGLCVALVLAMVVEAFVVHYRRRRHQRGEWAHQAAIARVAQDYRARIEQGR